jgi:hypothetical protein
VATRLSPAHRTWRTRVFVATWLSYAGGPRRNVLLGTALSIAVTLGRCG